MHRRQDAEPKRTVPPPPKPQGVDWRSRADAYSAAITGGQVQDLATALGVDPIGLCEMGLGFDSGAYTFPMFSKTGLVCGVKTRTLDGAKRAVTGSQLGVMRRLLPDDGLLLVCEGESDTAAALSYGFDAIGTPGAGQCADVVAAFAAGRDVVLVRDNDEAGATGAAKIAVAIRDVARSVRVVVPPVKDLREWRRSGATREDIEALIEAATPIESARTKRLARLLTLADLGTMPSVRWVVKNILPDGVSVLFGDANTGKTTLAVAFAMCVLHGQRWNGRRVRAGSVLFLAGESVSGVAARIAAWRLSNCLPDDPDDQYFVVDPAAPPLSSSEGQAELVAIVEDLKVKHGHAPALIVVDTVSAHWSESEDKTEFVAPALRALGLLSAKHGCAVLLLHHPRKPGEHVRAGGDLASLRGSTAWGGNTDAVLFLSGSRDAMELRTPKLRDAERDVRIPLQLQTVDLGGFDEDGRPRSSVAVIPGAPTPIARSPINQNVVDEAKLLDAAQRLNGTTTSRDSLVRMAGIDIGRGRAMVDSMVAAGMLKAKDVARGKTIYTVPPSEKDGEP